MCYLWVFDLTPLLMKTHVALCWLELSDGWNGVGVAKKISGGNGIVRKM